MPTPNERIDKHRCGLIGTAVLCVTYTAVVKAARDAQHDHGAELQETSAKRRLRFGQVAQSYTQHTT